MGTRQSKFTIQQILTGGAVILVLLGIWLVVPLITGSRAASWSSGDSTIAFEPIAPSKEYCAVLSNPAQKQAIINDYNPKTGETYKNLVTNAFPANTVIPKEFSSYFASTDSKTYPLYVQDLQAVCNGTANIVGRGGLSPWEWIQKMYYNYLAKKAGAKDACDYLKERIARMDISIEWYRGLRDRGVRGDNFWWVNHRQYLALKHERDNLQNILNNLKSLPYEIGCGSHLDSSTSPTS